MNSWRKRQKKTDTEKNDRFFGRNGRYFWSDCPFSRAKEASAAGRDDIAFQSQKK